MTDQTGRVKMHGMAWHARVKCTPTLVDDKVNVTDPSQTGRPLGVYTSQEILPPLCGYARDVFSCAQRRTRRACTCCTMHAAEALSLVGAADSGATTHQDGDSANVPLQQGFPAASLSSNSRRSGEGDAFRDSICLYDRPVSASTHRGSSVYICTRHHLLHH